MKRVEFLEAWRERHIQKTAELEEGLCKLAKLLKEVRDLTGAFSE